MNGILHSRSDLQSSSPLVSSRSDVPSSSPLVSSRSDLPSSSPLVSSRSDLPSSSPLDLRNQISRRIDDAAEAVIGRDAVWGHDDCVLWCADILAEPLGYDPARTFRGRYTTAIGYRRLLTRAGFKDLAMAIAAFAEAFGWRPIKPEDAQTGDIGILVWRQHQCRSGVGNHLVRTRNVQTCAIRRGDFWVVREEHGVANFVVMVAHRAWSITG